ncbi:MAG: antibiotic biosynthesis monooxygenase family protein [Pseudomonadota bacterium]
MSGINVIITFTTKPESAIQFSTMLAQVKQALPTVDGCKSVRLFAAIDNPCTFTLLEEWESEAKHKSHLEQVVSSGAWDAIAAHLATDPVSHYYIER